MRVRIRHTTRYAFDRPAILGPHLIRLHPAPHTRTRVLAYDLAITPAEMNVRWQHDPWGNRVARASMPAGKLAPELRIAVEATLEIKPVNPFDFFVDDRARELPIAYPDGLDRELAPFLDPEPPPYTLASWVATTPYTGPTIDYLVELNRRAAADIRYVIRPEPGIQTPAETLAKRSGSCRDIALLLAAALRSRGFAARFASGYLVQLADEGTIPNVPRGLDKDVVDLHAWAECFVPGAGWIGLDGTSGLLTGEGHVPLCCAVHPEQASPVSGSANEASRLEVEMTIDRIGHEPSPRRPFTEEQWAKIRAAGREVDRRLARAGLALTVGGEPTWTSREDPASPEWNHEALGPGKWRQGLRFAREVMARVGAGTAAQVRQGKWYPGESLPRWAIELVWRADGVPVWRDPALLALDLECAEPGTSGVTQVDAAAHARELDLAANFGDRLLARLGLKGAAWIPAYEDPWAQILEEQLLPPGVDPLAADLTSSEERRRLARLLGRGLGQPAGLVLPLSRPARAWTSDAWSFSRDRLYLVPGDSPLGLRLPLDRIGGTARAYRPVDVTRPQPPLRFDPRRQRPGSDALALGTGALAPGGAGVRTALVLEPRDGVLHAFLPPARRAEDWLELVAALEDASAELGVPVRLEGYAPPHDPRLQALKVTPDPGVIEVNLPVAASFDEYVATLESLADAANHAGLRNEKYLIDGREVGSGGGNHITLGGPTTAESPWIQRPELLARFLRYVQHHPSLSYFFNGLFVGPTSQAPRIDEARLDSLHELELALARLSQGGAAATPPWLADRLLRNVLTDVEGNTHRTEVSIDKLYDLSNPASRHGILELRAFEMPPHERMAALEVLLVRAIVARLERSERDPPLVRWGHQLHDRFMLPHFLWRDLTDVVGDLAAHELPLELSWFRPFLEYRFPVLGEQAFEGISLALRPALEPWPVLGEEPTGATTSRYVDSSLERLEVVVNGLAGDRYAIGVNGLALPISPAAVDGTGVAGVRFRAWQPPHCLQPHVGIHHPLRFDVVDTWARRSLGAVTYHVWHPEGRAFDAPPLTLFEAGARRAQRFTRVGHAAYPVELAQVERDPESPVTLDLRRFAIDRPRSRG